jgi:serine/threonine protein kinase
VLGKGGHGVVYAALHQSLNIPVAVKVLVSEHGPDPSIRTKLRHEARALARLNHSNIIRVLDFDDGEPPYVVMEYVEGPSLADLITQTGGIRVDRARDIFVQVCRGLEAAWGEGIVHRDIKPGNILLTRNGTAKLADLGLALTDRDQNSPPAAGGSPVGTCAYMAPEQARMANAVDFKADIYALGVTFYHAVTGQHPFPAKNAREALLKHATMAAVPPHEVAPQLVDAATSAVIMRMMAKTPEERHHSYEELIYELTVCGQASPVGETPRSATSTPPSSVGVPRQSGLFRWFRTQRETRTTGDSQGR